MAFGRGIGNEHIGRKPGGPIGKIIGLVTGAPGGPATIPGLNPIGFIGILTLIGLIIGNAPGGIGCITGGPILGVFILGGSMILGFLIVGGGMHIPFNLPSLKALVVASTKF